MMSGGLRGGGASLQVCTYKCVCNKPESEFLTGQVEYSRSYERLESCLATERSMMKSSTLFECGPLPPLRPLDVIHVISVPRPSLFFSQVFCLCVLLLNTNRRPKMRKAWENLYYLDPLMGLIVSAGKGRVKGSGRFCLRKRFCCLSLKACT